MYKQLITNLLFFLSVVSFPCISVAQNSTCDSALIVEEGNYEVANFVGNGAVFQGATAAVWYRFEPITDGVFTVSSCDGGGDTRLVILLLDNCNNVDNLQIINSVEDNCADGKGGNSASTLEVAAIAGVSYVIYWDNGQSEDSFTWQLSFKSVENSGEGATCETAIPITTGVHQVDSLTGIGAAFSDAVSAKWYQFIPAQNNLLAIDACESEVNTRLFVFEEGCEFSQIIGQDDDGCGVNGASLLGDDIIVDSGRVYYIYWDDHWSKSGFNFQLDLADIPSAIEAPVWATNISVYPNPADSRLFIDYDFIKNRNIKMTIYNGLGQAILKENWTTFFNGKVEISLSNYSEGIYFLNLSTNDGQLTRQFVINR